MRGLIEAAHPDHAILSEETPTDPEQEGEVVWVIDPLDGTINFLNGLPVFGVSIGVLERGRPVAGAIFVPSIQAPEGAVFHARTGGGAFLDATRITLSDGQLPGHGLLAALPSYFGRLFSIRPELRQRLGEVRSTGSVAYELALVACGTFQYTAFTGPRIWDVAAGIVLVQEAGGSVLIRQSRPRGWVPFREFGGPHPEMTPSLTALRQERHSYLAGTPQAAAFVASGLRPRSLRWRRLWRRLRGRLTRSPR